MVKDKFTSHGRVVGAGNWKTGLTTAVLDIFSAVVGNTEHYDEAPKAIAKSLAATYFSRNLAAYFTTKKVNSSGNAQWIDKNIADKQHCDGTRYIQFAPLNKEGWVELAYYSKIRDLQEAQQKKIVCVNMGTDLIPVSLGDVVTIDKLAGKYVVIQISQNANGKAKSLNYHKYEDENATKTIDGQQAQQIFAIPMMDNDEVVPPVIQMPVVRKSGPQTAFIVDNYDPKCQGRVRIAFPWQAVGDPAGKKLLDEAKTKHNAKKEEAITAENNRVKFAKLLDQLKKNTKSMQHLQDSMSAQPDAASQKTLLDEKINKLDALEKENKATDEDKSLNLALKDIRTKCDDNHAGSPSETMKAAIADKQTNEVAVTEKNLADATKKSEQAQKEEAAADKEVKAQQTKWQDKLMAVASPWVRVATPMATSEGGFYFRPQMGDEVLINFDGENVERPFVAGSLYSKEHTDPGGVMTIKSPSGQKMTFDVAYDDESMAKKLFPFLMSLQSYVPGMVPNLAMGGDARKLCGGISFSDEFGMFNVSMSSTDRSVSISSPFGNVSVSAFTGINIMSPNGDINIVGKNVNISAGNNLKLTSGTNVKRAGASIPGGKNVHEPNWWDKTKSAAKTGSIALAQKVRDSAIDKANDITKGFEIVDMKLMRSLADVFLRPIEGTLCVKSNNYLMLEAGKGQAQVPMERYSENWQKFKKFEPDADRQVFFAKTSAYINQIQQKVGQFCDDYVELKRDAIKKQTEYERKLKQIWDSAEQPKIKEQAFKLGDDEFKPADLENKKKGSIDYSFIKKDNLKNHGNWILTDEKILSSRLEVYEYLVPAADSYAEAVWNLQKKTREFLKCMDDKTIKSVNQSGLSEDKDKMEENKRNTAWIDEAFKKVVYGDDTAQLKKFLKRWQDRFGNEKTEPTANFLAKKADLDMEDVFTNSLLIKRTMVALFLLKIARDDQNKIELDEAVPGAMPVYEKYINLCFQTEDKVTDDFVMNNWSNVALLGPGVSKWKKRWLTTLKWTEKFIGFKKAHEDVFNNNAPKFGWDRKVWNDQSGKIIFSDNDSATYALNGENIEKWSHAALSNEDMLKKAIKGV